MKTPFEISNLYKLETGNSPTNYEIEARIGRYGDVIIDLGEAESSGLMKELLAEGCITYPDADYIHFLEQFVLSHINNHNR
jgi:hypothetical protein